MTRPQSIERIREALEAGPSPGIWEVDGIDVSSESVHGIAKCNDSIASPRWSGSDFATSARCQANAEFIAACNPSAIKELLTYLEGVERDAARYKDALKEIALAGMSPSPEMSEDGVTHWHASQAWHFIRIAARAISPPAIAKEPKP